MTRVTPNPSRPSARRGMVMPLVLIALAISMVLGMTFLTASTTASATSAAAADRLSARMIAESGIGIALSQIDSEQGWRILRPNGRWVTQQALGGGTFTVDVEDGDGIVPGDGSLSDDNQDPVVITSTGTYGGARHRVRAVRRPPALTGVAVAERVLLRGNALIDSYDPAVGYTPATAGTRAIASSNGISKVPYVLLRNSSRVNGDVYYGPGGSLIKSVKMDAGAVVTGTIGPLPMAADPTDYVPPVWPGLSVGDRSYSSGVTTLTGDLWCDRLTLSGTAVLRIVGDVKLRVDESLYLTDDARIQLGAPIAYAAATKSTIAIQDNGLVDSFDSSLGAYGGTNVGADAVLATNATLPNSISITLGRVRGNALTGVGSNPISSIVVAGGQLTGTRGALTAAMTIPPPPAWPGSMPANMGNYDVNSGSHLISGNLQTDSFKVVGSAVVQVSGHRVVRVNREFTVDDTARIEVLPNSSLTVYVAELITLAGNGSNANTRDASKFVIYGMGSGYTHTVDEDASVYAVIDAPTSSLMVTGQAQFFGAFVGNTLTVKGDGQFHADRNPAIPTANTRLPVTYSTGNKLTVYTYNALTVARNTRVNADLPDPLNMTINHLGTQPMTVRENALGYAQVNVREMTFSLTGAARWFGRVRARDLYMANTAVLTTDGSGGWANPGVLAEETIDMRDSSVITSVNGPAALASHGATDTTIFLDQWSTFKGDLYTAPGGHAPSEIRVAASATHTGTKRALLMTAEIAAPPSPLVTAAGDRNYTSSTTTVLTGDVYCRDFSVTNDAVIEIDGTTRIILSGDFRFSKNARLVLRPYARLTVFCPGQVLLKDNAQLNLNGNPTRFFLVSSANDKRVYFLTGSVRICATGMAPLAEMFLVDEAEFFGAFRGERLRLDKNSKMHCSEDLPAPITWLEQ